MRLLIYTTYFKNVENLPDNVIPISISAKAPNWWKGRQYKKLAPTYEILDFYHKTHNEEFYTIEYLGRVLCKLNPKDVLEELLSDIPEGCTIALVCYEKPGEFCHRHIVASWMRQYNIEVKEYGYED